MAASYPDAVERLAWEGTVDGTTALVLALLLAGLAAVFLLRERHAIGNGWAATFWLLRVAAFGCALWMLAGPTRLHVERRTADQAIAIFADVSESMDVVDPVDPVDSLRWTLAADRSERSSPLVRSDRLAVALGALLIDCQGLAELAKQHRPPGQLEPRVASIAASIGRLQQQADALQTVLGGRDPAFAQRAEYIVRLIEGPVTSALATVGSAVGSQDHSPGASLSVHVDQLAESVASARRRALALAADLAQQQADQAAASHGAISERSRLEKVAGALDAVEGMLRDAAAKSITIERYRFDRTVTPVARNTRWASALQSPALPGGNGNGDLSADATEDAQAPGATNISAVLARLADPRAGPATRLALILTDGRHNDPDTPPPQELAAQLVGLPVYAVPIGSSVPHRDVVLHRVEAPTAVVENDSAVIDVIVTAFDCAQEATSVVLRKQGQEIDRLPIHFATARGDQRVRFLVPAKELGWQEYIVEVEPVDGEDNTANNYQPVSFEVVRASIRVLLVDSIARWEHRYLSQLFRRDEHVEQDELLFLPRVQAVGEIADGPELPPDAESWARYDVVILGDIGPQQLSADSQRALAEFVRSQGGSLIVVAGSNAMPAGFAGEPLMDLLPVELAADVSRHEGYSLRLTDEGRFNSALLLGDAAPLGAEPWREVYQRFPVFGLSEYSRPKPTARTLLAAESDAAGAVTAGSAGEKTERAFLCWQRVGAGRVAYLAAPETYRLRWRQGDRLHHRFWGQFLRWITAAGSGVGSELVRLQTDRAQYTRGEPVEITVWLKDTSGRPLAGQSIRAEARTFDDQVQSVELTPDAEVAGRYFGTLSELSAGAYRISATGPDINKLQPADSDANEDHSASATITVRAADSIEMLNTQADRALLEQIAEVTGGQVIPPTAIGQVLELVSLAPEANQTIRREPLWNRWSCLFIVLGCLFTEWVVRKSKGLV